MIIFPLIVFTYLSDEQITKFLLMNKKSFPLLKKYRRYYHGNPFIEGRFLILSEKLQEIKYIKRKEIKDTITSGSIKLVKLLFNKYKVDVDKNLSHACRGGHKNIVDYMISKGADNWDDGLYGACQGGHKDLVDLMISKGASYCGWCDKQLSKH